MKLIEFQHDRCRGGAVSVFINPDEVASVASTRNDFGDAPRDRNESLITLKNGQKHAVIENERKVAKMLTEAE